MLKFYKDIKPLNYFLYYFLCVEIFYYFYVITYNLYYLVHDFMIMFYMEYISNMYLNLKIIVL